MNILITGLHGFVGSNLLTTLKANHQIYGLDIVAPDRDGVVKTFKWADLKTKDLPHFDTIIHLAGKAHDTKNQSKAEEYFSINTELTKKIFDFFKESSASKFIFFSSVKAAADFVPGDILTEDIIPAPKGPYGESKIAAEEYINSQLSTLNPQKKVYIFRPCMIHGPGNKGNLNLLYSVVSKGIPWPLGAFENRRSFVSIDNLCCAVDGFLNKDIESGIYHIADDEALSTNELIETICEDMGRKAHIWKINKSFMTTCAKIGNLLHLPLNTERLNKLTENYVVSNAKLKNALGINRMPVQAKDGLIKTIKSFSNK
ncbi:NAD-dependent epimerase/dehydratase family protein [Bacteroides sp. 519]|uniref:NAD-dependent epimerase/dehydratase family protein n=1 Tax=Bacteroides sp. 519 TaxID=2302937 RepID=UPI0013D28A0B|nr:NAD-dependent epimerase/dehydratase family protein [Bacteroides sp. 519]NDV60298.1 NAD-dependent epimerase/dehydratase family protein [Bacteroides sp. 519]